jgi:ABC-type antimicrobial peptide transport system permease subunit
MLSLQLLAAHRLRTALSVSGLLIGVAAVMVMAAIGRGAEQELRARLQTMGTDLLIVSAAPASRVAGRPRQVDVQTDLSADDAIAISRRDSRRKCFRAGGEPQRRAALGGSQPRDRLERHDAGRLCASATSAPRRDGCSTTTTIARNSAWP